jgi:hypothetical protein
MKRDVKESRTALLIRCTEEEANTIREAAKQRRRTVSGFVLHAVISRISVQRAGLQCQNGRAIHRSARPAPDKLLYEQGQTSAVKSGEVTGKFSPNGC